MKTAEEILESKLDSLGFNRELIITAMEEYADQFRGKTIVKTPGNEYEVIAETVCREFRINPKEINNNRRRPNVDANKIIAKVLNLKGYSHEKIAELASSKRATITARLLDYNIQYKFNKNFQSTSDNVFKSLGI